MDLLIPAHATLHRSGDNTTTEGCVIIQLAHAFSTCHQLPRFQDVGVWFSGRGDVERGQGPNHDEMDRPLPVSLFVCMIILIIRRCVVWSFFFISCVIDHVPVIRVTVASKSSSLSFSGYCGDVNSYLWFVNVVRAFDAVLKTRLVRRF